MRNHFTDQEQKWVEDYCNDAISEEEFAHFEAALAKSNDFRALARRYLAMESHLTQTGEMTPVLNNAWAEPIPLNPERKTPWMTWAVAAGIVFLLGLGIGGVLSPESDLEISVPELEDDGIAILQHAADAEWFDDVGDKLHSGSILSPGRLQLERGLAQVEFYNGARLILEGPVDVDLQSVDRVICWSGKLRAFVPPPARGFTVLSPQFELVDLGTEFGVEVSQTGEANVQVFDGEVELYPPDGQRSPEQQRRLLGGSGLSWTRGGEIAAIASESNHYPSFEDVQSRGRKVSQERFASWQTWSESLTTDPRLVVHYDFEGETSQLRDRSSSASHGTIIGSEWSTGRWPEKRALEFKRPGDRVRVNVGGEFDALTVAAWIRMDALTGRRQALLLTDEYRLGHVHWQIGPIGELRFGMRTGGPGRETSSGYASPALFSPRRIGVWTFVCSTYDRSAGVTKNYLNGREVSHHSIIFDQAIQIGEGDIGNWSVPLENSQGSRPVRNFIGKIDGLTIWSAALSPSEIRSTYQATKP